MDTQRNAEFLEEIRKRLRPERLYHSVNVAEEAKRLALHYGADPEKAYTAGLVHDIMKNTDPEYQLKILKQNGIMLSDTEKKNYKILHQMSGAIFLETELHVTDREILNAVRYHTTGRAGMSLLEKVLYIADYISADRTYNGVEHMRALAYEALDKAIFEGQQFTILQNVKNGYAIHEDSIAAYNELAK